jgi:high-affinity iron transporter
MLINTVLVFLQNILPIFVVFSLLFAQQEARFQSGQKKNKNVCYLPIMKLVNTTIVGLIVIGLLSHYMPGLSQLFTGMGLEIVFSILFSLIYCCIAASFLLNRAVSHKQWQYKTLFKQERLMQQQTLISLAIL